MGKYIQYPQKGCAKTFFQLYLLRHEKFLGDMRNQIEAIQKTNNIICSFGYISSRVRNFKDSNFKIERNGESFSKTRSPQDVKLQPK